MKMTVLVENSTISKEYINKHGLSIHLETKNHNILFDLGPDDSFLQNAKKLNINIEDVDILIISHGHIDHGGGLESFLLYNSKAKIYINKHAFENHYSSSMGNPKKYIGLDSKLKYNPRIIFTEDSHVIDENLTLLSNIKGDILLPKSNNNLYSEDNSTLTLDTFTHEQHLIIKESNKNILIAGCSHRGIINIIDYTEKNLNLKLDIAIGGLHLYSPSRKESESVDFINKLGNILLSKKIKIFTGHCTGIEAFDTLTNILGTNIEAINTGMIFEL